MRGYRIVFLRIIFDKNMCYPLNCKNSRLILNGVVLSLSNIVSSNLVNIRAAQCRKVMLWCFVLYLVTFSIAPFFRDFFAVLCLLCLIPYYALDYKQSTLSLFDGKKYFISYYIFLLLGIVFSQDILKSLTVVSLHSFTSLVLPFVAMESVRSLREVRFVVYALLLALIFQGFNGIYQYITGYDFIHATAIISGRLTGSFGDYRVGNYIALTLIPAFSMYFILRTKFKLWALPMTLLLFTPSIFLLFFSYTRNAYITLIAAAMFWAVLMRIIPWKLCAVSIVGLLGLLQLTSLRLSWDVIQNDGRWSLWYLACEVFKEFPVLGAGIGQYNSAFRALGLAPANDAITISHPHNIYLQFLCENGIIGLLFILFFLGGMLWWGYSNLRMLYTEYVLGSDNGKRLFWRISALFWCGWGAFLVSGIVGHNFFQRWWQALVMAYLGVMIGIIMQARREKSAM